MKRVFNDLQLQFIKENYNNMTYLEMFKLELFNGLTSKQIRTKASTKGLKKKRQFNKNYFYDINSKEKAYWLGLIYADGYVTDSNEFGIELDYKDKYILEKLNKDLGDKHVLVNRIRNKNFNGYNFTSNTYTLRIYSKDIVNGLIKNGVTTNKTKNNIFPKVDIELLFDFLRGFLDGDGCIYINNKNNDVTVSFTNSNEIFLKYLNETLNDLIGICGHIYKEKDFKYRLQYFKKEDVFILLNKLYKNCNDYKLERKYEKYKMISWLSQ